AAHRTFRRSLRMAGDAAARALHLDQDGLGMRADAQALYTIDNRFRVGALLKGLIPSSARWQSGYAEYEAPEVYLGAAARFPAPYFYGTLETDWQSEGLFHQSAKSAANLNAGTAYEDPGDLLAASNVGMEFLFDFGMALRFGLSELSPHSFTDVTTFGIGYDWRHILGLDYSFSPHPGLLSTHRISLQFTPSFPKFSGRRFRPHAEGQAPRQESQSQDGNIRTPAMQPRNASDPQSAPPVKADQSAKPTPGGVSPTPGIPEKPLSPAPGADQEILDNEDNEEEGQ
ncbi:MAG: hypothetical protein ABI036_13920, partial [Fibrobacteria bacterium]